MKINKEFYYDVMLLQTQTEIKTFSQTSSMCIFENKNIRIKLNMQLKYHTKFHQIIIAEFIKPKNG